MFSHRRYCVSEEESHHSSYRVAKTHQGLLGGYGAALLRLDCRCTREILRSQELADGCLQVCKSPTHCRYFKGRP